MKHPAFLSMLLAASALITTPEARAGREYEVRVRRDLDGDGHYNTKTYTVRDRCHPAYPRHGYGYRYPRGYYGYRPWYGGARVVVTRRVTPVYRSSVACDDRGLAADVQAALARRGYYRGCIDGEIGPRTRAAIRSYQVDRGDPVTGRIDGRLLRSLDLD